MPHAQNKDVRIWYESVGDGPALVLVHANPFDHDLWLYQAAQFSTWFRVVGIDIRGYGRSDKVTTPFTLKDMSDDVLAVMRHAGLTRAIVIGCSVGSGIALLTALDHPERFDSLVLVGGNSGSSSRYMKRVDGYRADLKRYHIAHMRELVSPAFAESALGRHLLNMFVEREARLSGEAIARVFMAGNSTDTTDRLPSMRVPTLVINGALDHSLAAGRRTAERVPGAVHKTIAGAGHACCIEKPDEFNRLVIDFLTERGLMPVL